MQIGIQVNLHNEYYYGEGVFVSPAAARRGLSMHIQSASCR